jgi:hypothetical protein
MAIYTITATCDGETATALVTVNSPAMNVTADVANLLVDITVQDITDTDRKLTVDWGDGGTTDTIDNVGSTGTGQHTYADDSGNPYAITVTGNTTGYVATTTATVVEPSPVQLTTPTNLASENLTETSFDVTWDEVTNADGYTATASPGNLTGTVVLRVATFSGLTASTEYTVSIVANGDGTTYSDSDAGTLAVTTDDAPAVQLDAPTNLTSSDLADTTFTVGWDAVTNASGYTVTFSPDDGTTATVTDTTAAVTGATASTEYTVSVVANGDGASYTDSEAATETVTTTAS